MALLRYSPCCHLIQHKIVADVQAIDQRDMSSAPLPEEESQDAAEVIMNCMLGNTSLLLLCQLLPCLC